MHRNEPSVLLQLAWVWQLWIPFLHSSTSSIKWEFVWSCEDITKSKKEYKSFVFNSYCNVYCKVTNAISLSRNARALLNRIFWCTLAQISSTKFCAHGARISTQHGETMVIESNIIIFAGFAIFTVSTTKLVFFVKRTILISIFITCEVESRLQ